MRLECLDATAAKAASHDILEVASQFWRFVHTDESVSPIQHNLTESGRGLQST